MTLRSGVSLWILLLFTALLKNTRAECDLGNNCTTDELTTLKKTETTVTLESQPNCSISTGSISGNGSITGLTPGAVHLIGFQCLNCCSEITTKPEQVTNLNVINATTSSMYVTWTKPEGNSSSYRVQWTDGTQTTDTNVTQTSINITDLTPGVQYTVTVTAVADDHVTEGANDTVSNYTKPGRIETIDVSRNTTSISLSWTKPPGLVFDYKVEWGNGGTPMTRFTSNQTSAVLEELTPGTNYTITITAVAGDNTEGDGHTSSWFTSPGIIQDLTNSTDSTSISLTWNPPVGQVFDYKVEWGNSGTPMTRLTSNQTSVVFSDLIPGSNYTITITAVAGDNNTKGDPFTFSLITKPSVVKDLTITDVTTSSVSLSWNKPEGNADQYRIQWSTGENVFSNTTTETSFTIRDLSPGFQYNISVVAAVGEPPTEGNETFRTTFTRPDKPENIIVSARGTDYLNISWTLLRGMVDHYVVNISNENLNYSNSTQRENTTAGFTDLYPGRMFAVSVSAAAGDFRNSSSASFATVPTPPGSIVLRQTLSSLHVWWSTPAGMEGAPNITYIITYQDNSSVTQLTSTNTNTDLSGLSSGTSYNVTVQTVGPQNLKSAIVYSSTFTLPHPVTNLEARPQTSTSITVEWTHPDVYRLYYSYLVQTYNEMGALVDSKNTSNNMTEVTGLDPGSMYNISVRTIAAPGSESTEEQTFSYTLPEAVTDLRAEAVNTTSIRLTWRRRTDSNSSYLVKVFGDDMELFNVSTENETFTFHPLEPGNLYVFSVCTVVAGIKSANETTQSYTFPEAVQNLTATGTRTSLSVSWTPGPGRVSTFSVLIYKDSQLLENATDLNNTVQNVLFTDLSPGVLYNVEVVAEIGSLNNSAEVSNATFPNPPGLITVQTQTVNSITFNWTLPDMNHTQYSFRVSVDNVSGVTPNNWFLQGNLVSGSPHNISVVTVGVLGYQSPAVTRQIYTRPYPVTDLKQTEITTSSVKLMWDQKEVRPDYLYLVQVSNNTFSRSQNESGTSATISGLQSGSNFNFTVTTQAADGTKAEPVTVSYYTKPFSVRELKAETLSTTSIRLTWTKPLEYKHYYSYSFSVKGSNARISASGETADVSMLNPGTECTLCIAVKAVDITGEQKCIKQYTKPEPGRPSISSDGSNSSVLVKWTKPAGNVEEYQVILNGSQGFKMDTDRLPPNKMAYPFENLSPGAFYSAVLITHSGSFSASSQYVTNATFPNPPGEIEIVEKTTSSIQLSWGEAPGMSGVLFHYQVTNRPSLGGGNVTVNSTTANNHTFTSLPSGTSFNISVVTVGVMGFKSERVYSDLVTTRPQSVQSLEVIVGQMNITIRWIGPVENQESYRYNVTWQRLDDSNVVQRMARSRSPLSTNSTVLNQTEVTIDNLDPGSRYYISVTAETSDGTPGASITTYICTNAGPVTALTCSGPNTANAEVVLNWIKPSGQNSGFTIQVNNGEIIHTGGACCHHTVPNLRHNTVYNVTVETQSCGEPSIPVPVSCRTGITNPPRPSGCQSVLVEKEHDRFSFKISSSLLNDSNGPITYIGVLVTGDTSVNADLKEYLGKTYNDWKGGETPVYLATASNSISKLQREEDRIVVGNGSKWNGYTNGALDDNTRYQYAVAIFTSLDLRNQDLVDLNGSLVSVTDFCSVHLPVDPAVIGTAVGATLGVFFILLLILIGFIIYWRRKAKKETSDIQIQSVRTKVSVPVRVEDYEAYYKKQKADSNCGFAEEFEDLKTVGTSQAKIHALTLDNKPKNRYNNVLPWLPLQEGVYCSSGSVAHNSQRVLEDDLGEERSDVGHVDALLGLLHGACVQQRACSRCDAALRPQVSPDLPPPPPSLRLEQQQRAAGGSSPLRPHRLSMLTGSNFSSSRLPPSTVRRTPPSRPPPSPRTTPGL